MEIVKDGEKFCSWTETKQEMWTVARGLGGWECAGFGLLANSSFREVMVLKARSL